MAKKQAKKKFDTISIVFLAISFAGVALAIAGICLDWFKSVGELLSNQSVSTVRLFDEDFATIAKEAEIDKTLTMAKVFGIAAVAVGGIAAIAYALKALNLVNVNTIVSIVLSGCAIAFGVVAFVCASNFVTALNDSVSINIGSLASYEHQLEIGAILTIAGSITAGAPLLLTAFKK